MKKKTLLLALAALTCGSVWAEVTDASAYFTNKPFGWATCASEDGTPYNINGGIGYGEPQTVTLTASGASDDDAIKNAITKYDIIYLDGSKGDFVVDTQIKITGATNKTIVGINNARLTTRFVLTDEIHAALNAGNLSSLSSTKQVTGTLPNGQTVTMDERAFYTKKIMMEATGDNSMAFGNSGIFSFDGSDSNIIIRNLTFVGPGSVDVDGVDLISQYGANHVWVDHCEFIDGMDGNLDTGKKAGLFVTYSWCVFRYTERSFSHPYSNGCGWLDGYTTPQLYITYANCVWGERCNRRLPQVGATYLHLLNCYYNCPNNSVGLAVNDYSKALVEGNYAADGVKSAMTVGSNVIAWETKDNYFPGLNSYNTDRQYRGGVTVPYTYQAFASSLVPEVLTAAHGAGATLDDANVLPDVEASEKPDINTDGDYQTVKLWNFKKWSQESVDNLAADGGDWAASDNTYVYNATTSDYQPFTANGVALAETDGLLFKVGASGQTVLYVTGTGSIRLNKPTIYIKVPDCRKNDKLVLTTKSANSSAERGMASDQTMPDSYVGTKEASYEMFVTADGDVELYTPQGGVYVYSIELQRVGETGIESVSVDRVYDNAIYDLNGRRVADDARGIVIVGGKKVYRR